AFTRASQRGLGWSNGAHGVRHSYAQERMGELQRSGLAYRDALETVSQEMGHFRPAITEVYLR
ncbi:site-specific integrase, partial [Brachybacterium sp. JB7]